MKEFYTEMPCLLIKYNSNYNSYPENIKIYKKIKENG